MVSIMNSEQIWGADYIRLAWGIDSALRNKFSIEKEDKALVDSYFGPKSLERSVIPVNKLKLLSESLRDSIPESEDMRRKYLTSQIQAMDTIIDIINGEDIPYLEAIKRIFGIEPKFKETKIDKELLEDSKYFKENFSVPRDELEKTSKIIFSYCKKETKKRLKGVLKIPRSKLNFEIVNNRDWAAYNEYIGNLRSLIMLNEDVPFTYLNLIQMVCHETYPGHHLEHSIKEKELYKKRDYLDSSIILTLAPESIISEGIATNAWKILFGDLENLLKFSDKFLKTKYKEHMDKLVELEKSRKSFHDVFDDARFLLSVRGWSEEKVANYLVDNMMLTPKDAKRRMRFMKHPIWRFYGFNYTYGEDIVKPALENKEVLRDIYSKQITPITLKELL